MLGRVALNVVRIIPKAVSVSLRQGRFVRARRADQVLRQMTRDRNPLRAANRFRLSASGHPPVGATSPSVGAGTSHGSGGRILEPGYFPRVDEHSLLTDLSLQERQRLFAWPANHLDPDRLGPLDRFDLWDRMQCPAVRLQRREDLVATDGHTMHWLILDKVEPDKLIIRMAPRVEHPYSSALTKFPHAGLSGRGEEPMFGGVCRYDVGSETLSYNLGAASRLSTARGIADVTEMIFGEILGTPLRMHLEMPGMLARPRLGPLPTVIDRRWNFDLKTFLERYPHYQALLRERVRANGGLIY